MSVTLIGLGVREGDLTLSAYNAMFAADKIFASEEALPLFGGWESLKRFSVAATDSLTKNGAEAFAQSDMQSALIKLGEKENVCYCVVGAVCDDSFCGGVRTLKKGVAVCEGVSVISHIKNLVDFKNVGVSAVPAKAVSSLKSCRAAIVYSITDEKTADNVQATLSDMFGKSSPCSYICGDSVNAIAVGEIAAQKNFGSSCSVAVEEGEFLHRERYDYEDLCELVRILRAPGGCPWDRVQTSESIKSNVVEEAYELEDAIERCDRDGILEEVGDVLLQAAFHSVLQSERGAFTPTDAISANVKKLIFRHSHIFGADKAKNETEALGVWDKNKLKEKHMTTFGETVAAVPKNMPACMRAQKVGKRAGKSGMDFSSTVSATDKLWEEVKELVSAMRSDDKRAVFAEAGDVLLSAVNCCRLAGVDCEEALRAATDKFAARFIECEKLVLKDGKNMQELDEMQLDYYWELAKHALKKD